ncbi:unnamed protein product [Amoebophrya sp. A120]|nr:unnamed protein product [Amoebophrya sp. A120]|eukprot:GSA120T00005008001.1
MSEDRCFYAKAVRAFSDGGDNTLEVKVGDIIRVVEIDGNSEWWGGHLYEESAQSTGWFPGCIVKRLSASEEQNLLEKKRRQEERAAQRYAARREEDSTGFRQSATTRTSAQMNSYREPERSSYSRYSTSEREPHRDSASRGSTATRKYEYEPQGEAFRGSRTSTTTTSKRTLTDPRPSSSRQQRLSNTYRRDSRGAAGGIEPDYDRDQITGQTECSTPSKPRNSNPAGVKVPSPGRSETVKKLEAENRKIKNELQQRLAQIDSMRSDMIEIEQKGYKKRLNMVDFIQGRWNEKMDERQIQGIEDGGFDPESLPPRFDEVKSMFANKTKDHPLQAEVSRLQKKLSEVQAQQRQCQQILESDEDLSYIFQRLRGLFNLPPKERRTTGAFSTRNRNSVISTPASHRGAGGHDDSFYNDDENQAPLAEIKPNLPPPTREVFKEGSPGVLEEKEGENSPRKRLTGNVKARISMFERPGNLDETTTSLNNRNSGNYRQ